MWSLQSFKHFLKEAGEAAGTLEVAKMSLVTARDYANKQFLQYQKITLDDALPDFNSSFAHAQKLAKQGSTQRKDMPVIDEKDVKDLQTRLVQGDIDIKAPFAKDTKPSDPFPQGLSGDKAKDWLDNGLPYKDSGTPGDDMVKVSMSKVKCGDLIPIQKQIYFDKCIDATAKNGVAGSAKFLTTTTLILSSDKRIIDGHHRWLSGVFIDPTLTMNALIIHLPISKLLPLTLAYSDAVGNERNK